MKLKPDYIVGFVDGEGCFSIPVYKHPQRRLGYDINMVFEIELRDDDLPVLERIQETLGCGNIYRLNYANRKWNPHVKLKVSNFGDIGKHIVPFFLKHPLQSKKRKSFELFCEVYKLFKSKDHLTIEGLNKVRKIKKQMNKYSKKAKEPPGYGKTVRPVVWDSESEK